MVLGSATCRPLARRGRRLGTSVAIAAAVAVVVLADSVGLVAADDKEAKRRYYSSSDPLPAAPPQATYYPPPPYRSGRADAGARGAGKPPSVTAAAAAPATATAAAAAPSHSVTVANGHGAEYVVTFNAAGAYVSIVVAGTGAAAASRRPPLRGGGDEARVGVVTVVNNGGGVPYLVVFSTAGDPLRVLRAPADMGVTLPAAGAAPTASADAGVGAAAAGEPAEGATGEWGAGVEETAAAAAPADAEAWVGAEADGAPMETGAAAADSGTAWPTPDAVDDAFGAAEPSPLPSLAAAVAPLTEEPRGIAGLPKYASCSADECSSFGEGHRCKLGATQDTFPLSCSTFSTVVPCDWGCRSDVWAGELLCGSDGTSYASRCFLNRASCQSGYTLTASSTWGPC